MSTALRDGIHRCSNDGQTVFGKKGYRFPVCSCGKGVWEYLATDNNLNPVPLLIGTGIVHATEIDGPPKMGDVLNLRGGTMNAGSYRISNLDQMRWGGKDRLHVLVKRVGEIDPNLPI